LRASGRAGDLLRGEKNTKHKFQIRVSSGRGISFASLNKEIPPNLAPLTTAKAALRLSLIPAPKLAVEKQVSNRVGSQDLVS
jgi:predicted Zn-dependent protease